MGTKNAATVSQNVYTQAMNSLLPAKAREHIANFTDDFIGDADTREELIELFDQFLDMCIKIGITINPKKVSFDYEDKKFYGCRLNKDRITPADRNLDPVRRMTIPKSRSELRSVMGVFNQFYTLWMDMVRRTPRFNHE